MTGRFDQALDQQQILRELNPLIYHQPYLAYIHNMARRHDLALRELERQLTLEKRSTRLYSHLASTYRWLGRPAEAIEPFLTSIRLTGASSKNIAGLREEYARGGVAGVGRFISLHYNALEAQSTPVPAMSRAEAFVLSGRLELAIGQIEVAFENREPRFLAIVRSPDYDLLRDHPTFQTILQQLGFSKDHPPSWRPSG